jgi:hypothetical protein
MDSKIEPALSQVGGTKVSRRTVARGAAWSVPAAAIAVSAPAFAASQVCEPEITLGPGSCKCPGQSQKNEPWIYYLEFCITDANNCDITNGTQFRIDSVKSNPQTTLGNGANDCYPGIAGAVGTVGTGGCTPVVRFTSTNSAANLDVTFTIVGVGQFTTFDVPTPPDCSGVLGLETRCDACEA